MNFLARSAVLTAMTGALGVAACGNDDSAPSDLVDAYCQKLDPCCPSDAPAGASCDRVADALTNDGIDTASAAASACAEAIDAEVQADFCVDFGTKLPACSSTLTTTTGGTCSPEVACGAAGDTCVPANSAQTSVSVDSGGICVTLQTGSPGSTPCVGATTSTGVDWVNPFSPTGSVAVAGPAVTHAFLCPRASGLSCDPQSLTCLPDLPPGSCTDDLDCAAGGGSCVDGTCEPLLAAGAACGTDDQCASSACVDDICAAASLPAAVMLFCSHGFL